ncbi:MAG: helix-turn-helix transcriptional regulator [Rhizobiales bacterium]|nr:helix-turn-helix transcriptional regulator [Hyphomicrobiales bacterium]
MSKRNIAGPRIKEARLKANMNQADLAAALSVDYDITLDRSDISEIETQVRGIKDYELDAIAQILDVNVTWLLRGEEA